MKTWSPAVRSKSTAPVDSSVLTLLTLHAANAFDASVQTLVHAVQGENSFRIVQ